MKEQTQDASKVLPAYGLQTLPVMRKNLQDITDPDVLIFVESSAVTKRLQELYENLIKISGIESLYLFTNIFFRIFMLGQDKKELLK